MNWRTAVNDNYSGWWFCKQVKIKLFMTDSFWRVFPHQNLGMSGDTFFSWTFDLLLINFSRYFLFKVWFLITFKKCCTQTYTKRNKLWNKNKEMYIFTCIRCWCWRILFFECRVRNSLPATFNFSKRNPRNTS